MVQKTTSGVGTIDNFMASISESAQLSKCYTNHTGKRHSKTNTILSFCHGRIEIFHSKTVRVISSHPRGGSKNSLALPW